MKAELSPLSEIRPAGALVSLDWDEIKLINRALFQLSNYPEMEYRDLPNEYFDPKRSLELGREFGMLWMDIWLSKRIEVV